MNISITGITMISPLFLTNIMCNQAVQTVVATTNGSVTASSTTSIILLKNTSNINNFTIIFPASPTDGQLFSITMGSTNSAALVNNGNGAIVVNGITSLSVANLAASTGGTSVTYIYNVAANSWYRFSRG